jgi:hypothetical protein
MAQSDGRAVIKDGKIIIQFPLAHLPQVVEGAWALGALETRWRITDTKAFAKDLVGEMNREDEQGTTLIHKMCDAAINELLENGGEGIEEHPNQDA